jgi:magnesium transporter
MARWATTVIVKGGADVDVRLLGPAGVTEHLVDELTSLLVRDDALVWVDIPTWDDSAPRVLAEVFTFHPLAIRDCAQRNQVPKVHVYGDHVFVVLHAPHAGAAGHVHYVELDQFIGPRFLVTVHGPLNPAVDPAAAMIEVNAVCPAWNPAGYAPRRRTSCPTRSCRRSPGGCGTTPRC